MLFVKFIVLLLLVFILISLFAGLFFLVKDKGQTKRTVNALTFRIGLSVLAIIVILIAAATGVIEFNRNPTFDGQSGGQSSSQSGGDSSNQSGG